MFNAHEEWFTNRKASLLWHTLECNKVATQENENIIVAFCQFDNVALV